MGLRLLRPLRLIRYRHSGGSYGSDGRWERGHLQQAVFRGSLQALQGNQRIVLQEGTRRSDYRTLYTGENFLRTEDDKADPPYEADEVEDCRTGYRYKVVEVRPSGTLIPHQQVTLLRLREGPR